MVGRAVTDFAPNCGQRGVLLLQRDNYQVVDVETVNRRADGRPVYLTESFTGVVENGCLVRIWGVLRDITERRLAEEELRASEQRFRSLYVSMAEGVALHEVIRDEHGLPVNYRLLDVNPRYEQMTGLAAERVIGKLATEAYGTTEPPYMREFAGVLGTRQPLYFETYFAPLARYFAVSAAPLAGDRFATIFFDVTDRKRADEALQARERLLDNIIDQSPYPIWISDAQGTLIRINQACCELLGITAADVVQQYNVLRDNIVEAAGLLPQVQAVFAEGRTAHFVLEYDMARWRLPRHGPAKCVTLEVTIAPVRDENGAITNAVIMHHDITQRERAENELRESERKCRALSQQFRTILEAIPGALVLLSPELRVVWANAFAARTLGLTNEGFLGQRCYQSRHGRAEPCDVCAVQRCFASGKVESGEGETPDGRIWQLHAAPVFDDHGAVEGVIEAAYEVTERRRAERELKASEARLRGVFRATPVGITFNIQRTIASVNDSMCELLGYSEQELLGRSARMFYRTQEEYEDVGRRLYAELPQKGHTSVETRFRRKDGAVIDVVLNGALLRPEDPAAGYVVTVQDVTERMRAETELAESRERFRLVIESVNEVLWLTDWVKRELLYVSPNYETVFGRSCQSLFENRRSWIEAVHREDRIRVDRAFAEKGERGEYTEEEYRIVRPDGAVRWIRDRSFPIRDAPGAGVPVGRRGRGLHGPAAGRGCPALAQRAAAAHRRSLPIRPDAGLGRRAVLGRSAANSCDVRGGSVRHSHAGRRRAGTAGA